MPRMMAAGTCASSARTVRPRSASETVTTRWSAEMRRRAMKPASSIRASSGDSVPESRSSCCPSSVTVRSSPDHSSTSTRYCG